MTERKFMNMLTALAAIGTIIFVAFRSFEESTEPAFPDPCGLESVECPGE